MSIILGALLCAGVYGGFVYRQADRFEVPAKLTLGEVFVGQDCSVPVTIRNKSWKMIELRLEAGKDLEKIPKSISIAARESKTVSLGMRVAHAGQVKSWIKLDDGRRSQQVEVSCVGLASLEFPNGLSMKQVDSTRWESVCPLKTGFAEGDYSIAVSDPKMKVERSQGALVFTGAEMDSQVPAFLLVQHKSHGLLRFPLTLVKEFEISLLPGLPGQVTIQVVHSRQQAFQLRRALLQGRELPSRRLNGYSYQLSASADVIPKDKAKVELQLLTSLMQFEACNYPLGTSDMKVEIQKQPKVELAAVKASNGPAVVNYAPPLDWEFPEKVNLAELRLGENPSMKFQIKNKSKRHLKLAIHTTCNCVQASTTRLELAAMESGEVSFSVFSAHLPEGYFRRNIYITDAANNMRSVEVSGKMVNQVIPGSEDWQELGNIDGSKVIDISFVSHHSGLLSGVRSLAEGVTVLECPMGVRAGDKSLLKILVEPRVVGDIRGDLVLEMNGHGIWRLPLHYQSERILPGDKRSPASLPPLIHRSPDPTLYLSAADAVKTNGLTLIDLRDFAAQQEIRIPGALAMKFSALEIAPRLKSESLVLFGNGLLTYELEVSCKSLIKNGFTSVKILRGGIPAWIAAGGNVEGNAEAAGNCQPFDVAWARDYDSTVIVNATGAPLPLTLLPRSMSPEDAMKEDAGNDIVVIGDMRPDSKLPGPVWHLQGGLPSLIKAAQDLPPGKGLEPRNSACGGCL